MNARDLSVVLLSAFVLLPSASSYGSEKGIIQVVGSGTVFDSDISDSSSSVGGMGQNVVVTYTREYNGDGYVFYQVGEISDDGRSIRWGSSQLLKGEYIIAQTPAVGVIGNAVVFAYDQDSDDAIHLIAGELDMPNKTIVNWGTSGEIDSSDQDGWTWASHPIFQGNIVGVDVDTSCIEPSIGTNFYNYNGTLVPQLAFGFTMRVTAKPWGFFPTVQKDQLISCLGEEGDDGVFKISKNKCFNYDEGYDSAVTFNGEWFVDIHMSEYGGASGADMWMNLYDGSRINTSDDDKNIGGDSSQGFKQHIKIYGDGEGSFPTIAMPPQNNGSDGRRWLLMFAYEEIKNSSTVKGRHDLRWATVDINESYNWDIEDYDDMQYVYNPSLAAYSLDANANNWGYLMTYEEKDAYGDRVIKYQLMTY